MPTLPMLTPRIRLLMNAPLRIILGGLICFGSSPLWISQLVAQDTALQDTAAPQANNPASPEVDPAQLKRQVEKLLEQLDGDSLAQRDQAEQELQQLGPAILSLLPVVSEKTPAELKVRLQRIRQVLEQSDIQSRTEASKVTLVGKMTAQEALNKLKEATGNELNWEGELSTMLELDLQQVTFWQALDHVLDEAKLDLNPYGDEGELTVIPSENNRKRTERGSYSGSFRFEATQVQSSRRLNSQNPGQLTVTLLVNWEPKLQPIYMNLPGSKIGSTIEGDATLAPSNPNANPEFTPVEGSVGAELELQLELPPRSASALQELKGELSAVMPGKLQKFRFDQLAGSTRNNQKLGDVSVTLQPARRNGAVTELRMTLGIDESLGVLDSYRGWVLNNEAFVEDPKGEKIANVGYSTFRMTETEVGMAYLFDLPKELKGYAFVYEVPGTVVRQNVPFVLKNVPLP